MKTAKTIITIIILSFILASCTSDEKKALNFIKTEVLPEEEIENYLMRYNAGIVNSEFWEDLEIYLNSICSPCFDNAHNIYLPYGWGNYYEIGKSTYCADYWTFNGRYGYYDSEKILHLIYDQVNEKIALVIEGDSIEYYGNDEFYNNHDNELSSYEDDDIKNAVLLEAVNFRGFLTPVWDKRVKMLGLEDTRETREMFKYKWTTRNSKQQRNFIFSLSGRILSKAVCMVRSNEFKLVDAQGIKTGENTFKVTYLLEPKLKMVFDVTKVGNTFCCDHVNVDGTIDYVSHWDEDPNAIL